MKRSHFILSIIAVSLLTAAATAFAVRTIANGDSRATRVVEWASGDAAANHLVNLSEQDFPDLTFAAETAVKAVVNIEKTEKVESSAYGGRQGQYNPFFEFFGIPEGYGGSQGPSERRSGGSGVIISPEGYIVTNNHVVENATTLKVRLNDNRIFTGTIVGTDPTTDVALIKIDATGLPVLPFGNSDALRLGEWVLAIGSPFDLQSTVTAGIVSAKARSLGVIPSDYNVESFIQTDAAVNPGNSGGALVNTRGELVGINTVIKSPTGSYAGYSFAIPSSIAQKVVVDLKEFGMVQRALLGVTIQVVDDGKIINSDGKQTEVGEQQGLYVVEVGRNSGAEEAGVRKGDVIVKIDDIETNTNQALIEYVATLRPNDRVRLTVKRDGAVKHLDVVLRNTAGKAGLLDRNYVDPVALLGGSFAQVESRVAKELKIDGGLRVTEVKAGGLLSKARVRRGYIITDINDTPIRSVSDISAITDRIVSIDGIYPDGKRVSYYTLDE